MVISHRINGKDVISKTFQLENPFDPNCSIKLPRYTEGDRTGVFACSARYLSSRTRKDLLNRLARFVPSGEAIELASTFTGMPIAIIRERITEGRALAKSFTGLVSRGTPAGKTFFAAIPSNDAREPYFFVANALVSNAQGILKPSRREPAITLEMVRYLEEWGLPSGYLNVVHGDSSNPEDRALLKRTRSSRDISILMGNARFEQGGEVVYSADHTRAIIIDPEKAIPHLRTSVENPLSCLAEHNFMVVGKGVYDTVVDSLTGIYQNLKDGPPSILETRKGRIEAETLVQLATILNQGIVHDTMRVHYPYHLRERTLSSEDIAGGMIVQHFSNDPKAPPNPLLTTSLPAYVTGVRCVDSLEQAIQDLEEARWRLPTKRSMAVAVYGDLPPEFGTRVKDLAYEVHHNKSPSSGRGIVHQGIDLREVLRRGVQ
ncbi:aldehyde dehydrogenase family protein [Candidatus Woesearchaeota archaeon]|nr:aldehyde dehydrogenase family protein [Candidatus Woesearchaeota archaeon]